MANDAMVAAMAGWEDVAQVEACLTTEKEEPVLTLGI